jgi:hypothetical protein
MTPRSGLGRTKFTPEQIIEALQAKHGMVYLAARALRCDAKTIYNMMKRFPQISQVRDEQRGQLVDFAESSLHKLIMQGNVAATIFFLKTQAKDRGYIERVQNEVEVVKPIVIQTEQSPLPTREELIERMRAGVAEYDAENAGRSRVSNN